MCEPSWAICYHTNSNNPRALKWYYVARVIEADDKLWELHWHPDLHLRGNSRKEIRERALDAGLPLLHGVHARINEPRGGSILERVT